MRRFYGQIDQTSTTSEWFTPAYIFTALNCTFDLDPASPGPDRVPWLPARQHYTIQDDGLSQPWLGFTWLNAPWGRNILPRWLDKFREHGDGVTLVPERTSTKWWQRLVRDADLILFVDKKIKFISSDGRPTSHLAIGSTLVAYGPQAVEALSNCKLGLMCKPYLSEERTP